VCVCVCVCVRLRISASRTKLRQILHGGSSASKAGNLPDVRSPRPSSRNKGDSTVHWVCTSTSPEWHQHVFFHLPRLCKLSRTLDIDARKRLVCALNTDRCRVTVIYTVDYCNSALAGLSDSALAPLQRVLHATARIVLDLQPQDHITVALQTLHWLPMRQRITYKLCILMHSVAFGYAPTYLLDAVVPVSNQCYQEERICGRQTVDCTTYHGCHRQSVPELVLLLDHKRGISYLHQSAKWTASRRSSAI